MCSLELKMFVVNVGMVLYINIKHHFADISWFFLMAKTHIFIIVRSAQPEFESSISSTELLANLMIGADLNCD